MKTLVIILIVLMLPFISSINAIQQSHPQTGILFNHQFPEAVNYACIGNTAPNKIECSFTRLTITKDNESILQIEQELNNLNNRTTIQKQEQFKKDLLSKDGNRLWEDLCNVTEVLFNLSSTENLTDQNFDLLTKNLPYNNKKAIKHDLEVIKLSSPYQKEYQKKIYSTTKSLCTNKTADGYHIWLKDTTEIELDKAKNTCKVGAHSFVVEFIEQKNGEWISLPTPAGKVYTFIRDKHDTDYESVRNWIFIAKEDPKNLLRVNANSPIIHLFDANSNIADFGCRLLEFEESFPPRLDSQARFIGLSE